MLFKNGNFPSIASGCGLGSKGAGPAAQHSLKRILYIQRSVSIPIILLFRLASCTTPTTRLLIFPRPTMEVVDSSIICGKTLLTTNRNNSNNRLQGTAHCFCVGWTPSIGRKVDIPRGILPHIQGGSWSPDLTPFYQAVGIQTEPGIREGSYGQFYPNTT